MTDRIYVICKDSLDCKHQHRIDKREFIDPNECRKEAQKKWRIFTNIKM